MGDSRHSQNIQINKVIGENEKCVFYFMEKTKWTFWPTQYVHVRKFKLYGRYKIKSYQKYLQTTYYYYLIVIISIGLAKKSI